MTTLKTLFLEYGYMLSAEVAAKLAASQAAQDEAVALQIATLTGENTQMNDFLGKVQLLLDAEPGTAEFNEGTNLFTHIADRYATLSQSLAGTNTTVAEMAGKIAQFVLDLAALALRVSVLESGAAVMKTSLDSAHTKANNIITAISDAAGDLVNQLTWIRAGLNGEPKPVSGN